MVQPIDAASVASDAETLDSVDSSQFVRADANDSLVGDYDITGTLSVDTSLTVSGLLLATTRLATPDVVSGSADTIYIQAGDTSDNDQQGAGIELKGGEGYRVSGTPANNRGGDITIEGGDQGNVGRGGDVILLSGLGSTGAASFSSGNVSISSNNGTDAGDSSTPNNSGTVSIFTGNGGSSTADAPGSSAGLISLTGGDGGMTLSTGADNAGDGGSIDITAGDGGTAAVGTGDGGDGGNITITAGNGGSSSGGSNGSNGYIFLDSPTVVTSGNVPSTATDPGVEGEVAWDSSYFYVCVSENTWVRTALSTW